MKGIVVNSLFFWCIPFLVAFFSIFPLTDTDIWWHLACAREWVTTWTPIREPVVNVHDFFQQTVAFVYDVGGAPLLVAFKAVLWGGVFALFLLPSLKKLSNACHPGHVLGTVVVCILLLFVFRFQFEIRPVVFSLLFLGIYWNVLPWLFNGTASHNVKRIAMFVFLLALQWIWCKSQGLYILGPIFATMFCGMSLFEFRRQKKTECVEMVATQIVFVLLLFAMPFLHQDGLNLFLYPFGLLDRLLGLSPSAAIFASEIAENRSPMTLLMAGENVFSSSLMVVFSIGGIALAVRYVFLKRPLGAMGAKALWLLITAFLALIAERNFVLFLPVLIVTFVSNHYAIDSRLSSIVYRLSSIVLIAFLLGLWGKSLLSYDSAIAYQRVPVAATEWMKEHPHSGKLFNDDRAGGYLSFMNPSDSTYIDGRFILKTADFFERYLEYSKFPQLFLRDADSLNIDRVVLPLRYYARWDKLIFTLDSTENWHVSYRDPFFVVMDR